MSLLVSIVHSCELYKTYNISELHKNYKICAVLSMKDVVKKAIECNEGATDPKYHLMEFAAQIVYGVVSATSIDPGKFY